MARKVLICGINSYPTAPLRGCVNDARLMYDIFIKRLKFNPDDVRVVIDQRATTQGIKDRLNWLFSGNKSGDTLVFHYSGHGSQIRDRGPKDELSDNLDEIICPVDLDWQTKIITDDDLAVYLKRVPKGARAYMVLDCCHSGDGTRGLVNPEGNPGVSKVLDRYLPPPFDLEARFIGRNLPSRSMGRGLAKPKILSPSKKETVVPGMNHLLLSGCKSTQTSADAFIGGKFNGALTWALVSSIMESGPADPARSIYEKVIRKVKSHGFVQDPQLEGPQELMMRPLFS